MKRFLTAVIAAILALSLSLPAFAVPPSDPIPVPTPTPVIYDPAFVDCDDPSVIAAYHLGVVNGSGEGYFHPNDTLTHAEWTQMMYNAFASKEEKHTHYMYYWSSLENGADGYEPEVGWWVRSTHWVEDAAVYPHYAASSDALKLAMWESLYDFYQDESDYYGNKTKWANESASYDWCITMMYLLFTVRDASYPFGEDFATTASLWAAERDASPNSNWRHQSMGQFMTRAEACELFLRLGEIS